MSAFRPIRHFGLLAAAGLAACSPAGLLNGASRVARDGGARLAVSGASYAPGDRHKLDVWVPANGRGPWPVVVFFYGGGWVAGSRGDYGFVGRALASRGYVTILPDYRLVPQVRFPAFIEDGADAIRWTRDHAVESGGDPRRIAVMGHSAGAYIAAMLALDPHYLASRGVPPGTIRAGALLAGPYDFFPFTEQRGRDALGNWPRPEETQPVHFARAGAPPLLLMAGTADTVVRPRNSQRLAAGLAAKGATVELKLYPGRSHIDLVKSFSPLFRGNNPALADSLDFLARYDRPEAGR